MSLRQQVLAAGTKVPVSLLFGSDFFFFYQLRFWFLETGLIESYLTVGGSSTFVSLS